ncbi:MAG: hypothetical protein H0W36_11940 [Gemmatimonadetes bacterium]|nr:hypothetical protein [Acidimicrobiia bacterium]MBA3585215.1 hypothetical protein [Gemmatimonadota bacterium]
MGWSGEHGLLGISLVAALVLSDRDDRERLLVAGSAALFGSAIVLVTLRMTPRGSRLDRGPMRVFGIAGLLFVMALLFVVDAIRLP